ncbi:threonine ammonia-lyase [Longimicrobium sp.]|uniref:threonine ammonia-lyase n=1 Tax=Longimicrobium sp. TaxID=2029185 RepID=UPI002D18076D|nr:threonine ammonia-lyase [Longimicrobium sp.]HSU16266.1 threonine ammonia-lyase [Longimicrobium sp.]
MLRLDDIRAARERIAGRLVLTPCTPSEAFGEMFGGKAFFKFENLQRTGSFKERGALNTMLSLPPDEMRRGVIAASAGNHAQGVAFHARRLGIPATIVMPERTPLIKVSNTERYGARVVLHGSVYDEAMAMAMEIRAREGQALIHPFDMDPVIAGQGTIGLELLEQCPEMDVVVVPVGGGGLISGIAMAIKEMRPGVRVVGVESAVLPAALRAREAHARVTIPPAETIADGIAVRIVGENTFGLIEKYVDELVAVDEEEIASAVLLLLEREKTVAEPAAAASVAAAVYGHLGGLVGKNVVMLLSGGNVDVTLISRIIERGLVKDGRMARMNVRVKDRPGTLATLTACLAESGANIVSLEHRRGHGEIWVTEAEVALTLETRGPDHVEDIARKLGEAGYVVERE